ncbi:MAG: M42 family metallopeptidase [Anaerolineae bacterium]|nr:M42 family metallopeptidase [Anaerolineae bacterium]MDH7474868.1 M42 family metallopeptidase [Anaerolineae bacterium]
MKELIKKLVETYGPSGNEDKIRQVIQEEIAGLADEVRTDALGNLIARKRGQNGGKRVMLAAHMDEIGVIVTHVDEKGFLRFGAVGGVWPHTLLGGRVVFANGTVGVIGTEKVEDEERNKVIPLEKLFIDVGAVDKTSVPVQIGDVAGFSRPFADMGKRLVAKAFDDRIGCAVLIQTMRDLKKTPHDVYFVFSVQEEVGLRGAMTSAYGIEPEMGLSVDVTLTGDTPEAQTMAVELGKGPAIKVKDGRMLAHPGVKRLLVETAEAIGIPYQLEVLERGTTDATAIQVSREGVPAGCVSIPCRYVHTPSEMVDYDDVTNAVKLLVAMLEKPIIL